MEHRVSLRRRAINRHNIPCPQSSSAAPLHTSQLSPGLPSLLDYITNPGCKQHHRASIQLLSYHRHSNCSVHEPTTVAARHSFSTKPSTHPYAYLPATLTTTPSTLHDHNTPICTGNHIHTHNHLHSATSMSAPITTTTIPPTMASTLQPPAQQPLAAHNTTLPASSDQQAPTSSAPQPAPTTAAAPPGW